MIRLQVVVVHPDDETFGSWLDRAARRVVPPRSCDAPETRLSEIPLPRTPDGTAFGRPTLSTSTARRAP